MEDTRKQKSGLYILVGIVIGGLIFSSIVYLLMDNKKTDNTDNNNDNAKVEEKNNIKILSGTYASSPATVILNNKEVYISLEPCPRSLAEGNKITYKDELSQEFCESVETLLNSYKEFTLADMEYETVSINSYLENPDYIINNNNTFNTKFMGIKLNISDVKSIYPVMNGQDTIPNEQGIAIIKNDGSFAFISFEDIANNKITPKTIDALKNIVKVETKSTIGGIITYVIDKDGKEAVLYNHIEVE